MRRFVKPHRRTTLTKLTRTNVAGKIEDKVPKTEGDMLKFEAEAEFEMEAARVVDGGFVNGRGDVEKPSAPAYAAASASAALSDEETQRTLWPDSFVVSTPSQALPPDASRRELKEKFRRSDPAFAEGKMLLQAEDKQLRGHRDVRVGLVRDGG